MPPKKTENFTGSLAVFANASKDESLRKQLSMRINELHGNNRLLLDSLNLFMSSFGQFMEERFPEVDFALEGRKKSPESCKQNMAAGKNLFDVIAFKCIVNKVHLESKKKNIVEDALNDILVTLNNIPDNNISPTLQEMLNVYKENKDTDVSKYNSYTLRRT